MSLEGTLETIALPDVLALLSVTTKTGELRVEADGGDGSLWLDGGRVCGFDVGKDRTPVDAFFSLLRFRSGSFRFHTDGRPVKRVEPLDVGPVLEEAESRLIEWPSIVAVVPSLASALRLSGSVKETVVLTPEQWGLIASIGSGQRAGDVLDELGLGEFEGCRALKELVDLDLVRVEPASALAGGVAKGSSTAVAGPATGPEPWTSEEEVSSSAHAGPLAPATTEVDDPPEATETGIGAAGIGAVEIGEAGIGAIGGDASAEQMAADDEPEPLGLGGWAQDIRRGSGYDASVDGLDDIATDGTEKGGVPAPAGIEFGNDVWQEPGEEVEPEAPVVVEEPEVRGDPVNRGLLLKFLGSARN